MTQYHFYKFISSFVPISGLYHAPQVNRLLYSSRSLWCLILTLRVSVGPLACPSDVDVYQIPLEELRRVGFKTASLARNWSRPKPILRGVQTLQGVMSEDLIGVIPGTGILLSYRSSKKRGLSILAWDFLANRALAFLEWDVPLCHKGTLILSCEFPGTARVLFVQRDSGYFYSE